MKITIEMIVIDISTRTRLVCTSYTCISCTCTLVCMSFLAYLLINVGYFLGMCEPRFFSRVS
jgi:hypothetical protein